MRARGAVGVGHRTLRLPTVSRCADGSAMHRCAFVLATADRRGRRFASGSASFLRLRGLRRRAVAVCGALATETSRALVSYMPLAFIWRERHFDAIARF